MGSYKENTFDYQLFVATVTVFAKSLQTSNQIIIMCNGVYDVYPLCILLKKSYSSYNSYKRIENQ